MQNSLAMAAIKAAVVMVVVVVVFVVVVVVLARNDSSPGVTALSIGASSPGGCFSHLKPIS